MPIFPYNRQIFHAQAGMLFLESAERKILCFTFLPIPHEAAFANLEKVLARNIAHTPDKISYIEEDVNFIQEGTHIFRIGVLMILYGSKI